MPAYRLSDGSHTAHRFDVLGEYHNSRGRFIKHVALLDSKNAMISDGATAQSVHMRPPLSRDADMEVHVVGSTNLTNTEKRIIANYFQRRLDELSAIDNRGDQYIVHPIFLDVIDEETGREIYRRYSCVGFVIDCYQHVGIFLLQVDSNELPEIDLSTIQTIYPLASSRSLRTKAGLAGDGPWRVVLPGYVIHSLDRDASEIRRMPYKVNDGDYEY